MKVKEPVRIFGSHLFPTLILDRLVDLPEILNTPKSVQEHLDYDLALDRYINLTKRLKNNKIKIKLLIYNFEK